MRKRTVRLFLFTALLVTCANGSPSELEVDSYVETFSGLLWKNVTLDSLTQLADNCDYYANMSTIGGRVIAESLRNDSTKSDSYLRQLRHKIIPLWDRRARRSSDRKKRGAASEIEELQKSIKQRFDDVMDHQSASTNEIVSSQEWSNFHSQVTSKLSTYDYDLTDVTTPDDLFMGERGLRQLCDSIDYRPRRVRIYIEVILTRCLFGCDLYRVIAQEKFTVLGVNDFASILHHSFVKIMMYDTICDELVYESENNKAIYRRRNAAQLQELLGKIVKTVAIIKEEYWPNHALRLSKNAIGNSDVAVPEAAEVGRTYRRVAERILANLTSKYPRYSYDVVVSYPHESSEGHAVLYTNSSVAVGTASPHRNVHVRIFRRTQPSRPRISLTEFDGMKNRIVETFKSAGTVLADGLRKLNSSMPELFADGGFANAYATRCHRSSDPAVWTTSPFTVTVDHYSGIFPFRRCAFIAFFP